MRVFSLGVLHTSPTTDILNSLSAVDWAARMPPVRRLLQGEACKFPTAPSRSYLAFPDGLPVRVHRFDVVRATAEIALELSTHDQARVTDLQVYVAVILDRHVLSRGCRTGISERGRPGVATPGILRDARERHQSARALAPVDNAHTSYQPLAGRVAEHSNRSFDCPAL